MGRLLRLLVMAAVAWAAWHAGTAAWLQFQFSDEVGKIAQFGADRDEEAIRTAVLESAAKLELPVAENDIRVRRQERPTEVFIDVAYTAQVEILPRFKYPWTFNVNAHGWFVPGGRGRLK